MKSIGCFVSSHGFGHAARISAVLEALQKRGPFLPYIFSTTGKGVFSQTLQRFVYHEQLSDIGFVQNDAFQIDIQATTTALDSLLPYSKSTLDMLARICRRCSFILCDISPLGILVAEKTGIPSVLIENFTWDLLYQPLRNNHPELSKHCDYLRTIYDAVDIHIQTEPLCAGRKAEMQCGPIFRSVREQPQAVRSRLPCGTRKIVLITLGGIGFSPAFLDDLQQYDEYFFLFGGQEKACRPAPNVQLLDRFSKHYHPDLINCVDLVVFKSGYSTLAEVYQTGTPSICVQREGFAESAVLEEFARQHLQADIISQDDFISGKWLRTLPRTFPERRKIAPGNGADDIADYLMTRLG
jgi:UDP:flavonoid glycosyltransferase YjiC (YdhE family)